MDTRMERGLSSNEQAASQELILFGVKHIEYYWPQISQALDEKPELWNTVNTKESLKAAALSGNIQVWALSSNDVLHVVFFTQFYRTHATMIFQIFWAYGENLISAMPMLSDVFDNFASKQGATQMEIQGRKGFEPFLKKFGFRADHVTYSRPIAPTRGN